MKNIIILFFACLFSIASLNAQSNSVKSFYDKYTNDVKVTDYTIQGWMLKLATEYADDEEAGNVLEKITQLRILLMEDGNPISSHEYNDFMKTLRQDDFEELLKVKDKDCDVDFFIREDGEMISDLLMLVHEKDGFVLISLEGLFSMKDLKNLNLDIEGAEHLEKAMKKLPRA